MKKFKSNFKLTLYLRGVKRNLEETNLKFTSSIVRIDIGTLSTDKMKKFIPNNFKIIFY